MVECPYHHKRWRGGLQCLVNEFRGTFSLLHKYVRRLPAVVCACKGRSCSVPSGGLKVLFELQQWLEREGGDGPLARVRPTLERFLAAGSNESLSRETREALIGVVTLVRDLSRGDYHLLDPSLQQTEEVKEKEEEFPLHLSSDCLGLFMGRGGKHIKPLCKEYSVKVHLGGETGQSGRHITGSTVRVTVSYQGDYVEGFKAALQKRAQEVLEKKQKHKKNVEHYWKHKIERDRVKWQRRLDSGRRGPGRAYHSPKEAAKRQFEKKQQHSKPKGSDGKPSFAALFGGHCFHCMAPYTSGQLQEGACNYHSGFLVAIKPGKQKGFKWTCCNKRTIAQHPTHELHTKTGCCTGRHVWRTGKPTRGKAALLKDTDSSDFYVQ